MHISETVGFAAAGNLIVRETHITLRQIAKGREEILFDVVPILLGEHPVRPKPIHYARGFQNTPSRHDFRPDQIIPPNREVSQCRETVPEIPAGDHFEG